MTTEYKFRLRSPTGTLRREFNNVKNFSYTRTVNEIGMATIDVITNNLLLPAIDNELDCILEIFRRDRSAGIDWYCDFRGFWRDEMRESDVDGLVTSRLYFPGTMHKLSRAIVAYRGDDSNRATFTAQPVETIMNQIVKYNCTAAGTVADGRAENNVVTNVAVEADGGYGVAIDFSCQWRNVLDALQELTRMAPGDFDVVHTGADQFEYRFYPEQLGTDRRATVVFSLDRGNMDLPFYNKNKMNERTIAICAGNGDEATRDVLVRIPSYSNYAAGTNAVEFFVDGRGAQTTDELQAIGDAAIWEMRAESTLAFKVLQTKRDRLGRDYFLGDLVVGIFEEMDKDLKIYSYTVVVDGQGNEDIQVDMRDA